VLTFLITIRNHLTVHLRELEFFHTILLEMAFLVCLKSFQKKIKESKVYISALFWDRS